jgi:DNA-binding NtrC family response regulator
VDPLKVLIVDDNEELRRTLSGLMGARRVTTASTKAVALSKFRIERPRVVFLDVHLPDGNGLDLLEVFLTLEPFTQIVVVTGEADVDLVVQAMRRGATDFLEKPFSLEKVEQRLALAEQALAAEGAPNETGLVGQSPPMLAVMEEIRRVAAAPAVTAVILGESGTGKELAARALHTLSPRATGPFVPVNCAALTEQLLEAELFGYERGAFTGASADGKKGLFEVAAGGTIFLDEIAETGPGFQAAVLRAIEQRVVRRVGGVVERPIDVRILAATNRDLVREVRMNRFRADLFFRLFVVPIVLPPLRDRPGDVRVLAQHFFEIAARGLTRRPTGFSRDALDALERYSWPGNVRELRNVVERGVALAVGPEIGIEQLRLGLTAELARKGPVPATDGATPPGPELVLETCNLDDAERRVIEHALAIAAGNKRRAAELLGINRTTLYNKLRALGLEGEEP